MKESKIKSLKMSPLDELFGEDKGNEVSLSLDKLVEFEHHPFKVTDDNAMEELTESIKENGVITPVLVRKHPVQAGKYEIISGHRRCHASALAGLESVPAVIKEVTDDEAILMMVDTNLQRETVLPSEKAWSYRMKNEALKRQGKRNDLNNESDQTTAEQIGGTNDSARQVFRYIRLTYLDKELLDFVDEKKINISVGVSLSYLSEINQRKILDIYYSIGKLPDGRAAERLKACADKLSEEEIQEIIYSPSDKTEIKKVVLNKKKLSQFFEDDTSSEEIENIIINLLTEWKGRKPDI